MLCANRGHCVCVLQFDIKGRNFLHIAVQKADLEAVLFLLSVCVNVNSRVHDSAQMTPLHLAVVSGNEMIVRNLVCMSTVQSPSCKLCINSYLCFMYFVFSSLTLFCFTTLQRFFRRCSECYWLAQVNIEMQCDLC